MKKWLTVKELSELLSIKPATLYSYYSRGILPGIKIGPRLVRFSIEDVEEFLEKKKQKREMKER